jgi:hypothetical protein
VYGSQKNGYLATRRANPTAPEQNREVFPNGQRFPRCNPKNLHPQIKLGERYRSKARRPNKQVHQLKNLKILFFCQ